MNVLGCFSRPIGGGVPKHDLLAAAKALRQRVAIRMGLPRSLGRQAGIGGVALGLPMTDQEDIVGHAANGFLRGEDLLVAVVLGQRPLHLETRA